MSQTTDAANRPVASLPAPAAPAPDRGPAPNLPAADRAGQHRNFPPPPPASVTPAGAAAPTLPATPPGVAAIAATPSNGPLSLDGELPRLASPPAVTSPAPAITEPAATEPAPASSSARPAVSDAAPPSAPATASTAETGEPQDYVDQDDPATDASRHPMAHLMPAKTAPSDASRKAAALRTAKKAKTKKIKVGVAAGLVVFAVAVGPVIGRWLVDAINEAGSTGTEQPAD